jgi:hypothetical protein
MASKAKQSTGDGYTGVVLQPGYGHDSVIGAVHEILRDFGNTKLSRTIGRG